MNTSKNNKSRNFAIGLAIGIPIGTPIGLVLGNLALGPAAGVVLGLILGRVFNAKDTKQKEGETSGSYINDKIWKYTVVFGVILLIEIIVLFSQLKS